MSDMAQVECKLGIGLAGASKHFTMKAYRSDFDDEATKQTLMDELRDQALEYALQNYIDVSVKFPKEWEETNDA
jgi:hypothetical protein